MLHCKGQVTCTAKNSKQKIPDSPICGFKPASWFHKWIQRFPSTSIRLHVVFLHPFCLSFHRIIHDVAIRNWYTLCTRFKWSRTSSGRNIHSMSLPDETAITNGVQTPHTLFVQSPESRDLICSPAPQGHATSMDLQDSVAKDSLTY